MQAWESKDRGQTQAFGLAVPQTRSEEGTRDFAPDSTMAHARRNSSFHHACQICLGEGHGVIQRACCSHPLERLAGTQPADGSRQETL